MKRLLTVLAAKREYVGLIVGEIDEKRAKRLKEAFKRAEKAGLEEFYFSDQVIKEEAGLKLSIFAQRAIIAHDTEFLGSGRTVQWIRAYFVRGKSGNYGACDITVFKSALYRGEETRKGFKFVVLENGLPIFNPVYMVREENASSKDGSPWYSLSFLRRSGEKMGIVPCFGRMSDSALKLWAGETVKPEYIAPIIVPHADRSKDELRKPMIAAMIASGRIPDGLSENDKYRMWYRLSYNDMVSERVSAKRAGMLEDNELDTREPKNKEYSSVFVGVIVVLAAFYAHYEIGISCDPDLPRVPLVDAGECRTLRMLRMLADGASYGEKLVSRLKCMGHNAGSAYKDLLAREYWILDREKESGKSGTDEWIAYCIIVRSGLAWFREKYEID